LNKKEQKKEKIYCCKFNIDDSGLPVRPSGKSTANIDGIDHKKYNTNL
jgi:hypothetical protein